MVQAPLKEPIADDRDAVGLAGAAIGEADAVGIDKLVPSGLVGIGRIKSDWIPAATTTKSSSEVT
jgi:hypothetical protein